MKESWLPVKNFENRYLISNYGNVKSLIYNKELKQFKINSGYNRIALHKDKYIKNFLIHRLVAETFIPNPNNFSEINHKNGIKTDNYVLNLEWCTSSHNKFHAFKHGLRERLYGNKNGMCKLNEEEIEKIRNEYNLTNINQKDLAKKYKVTQAYISFLINNRRRV
jgi:hypothetical protein